MSSVYIDTDTQVYALFGHPVKHSFSPVLHNSAFKYLNLNYIYTAFDIMPRNLEPAIFAVEMLNLGGVNITIPHKEKVIDFLDELDISAQLSGSVNTVVNRNNKLTGYNTDGPGFTRSLQEDCSFNPAKKTVLIAGAGGAARAVGMQLALSGASAIGIFNRRSEKASELAQKIKESTGVSTEVLPWPREEHPVQQKSLSSFFSQADLVVNCTPLGMSGVAGQMPPLPYHLANPGQVAYDLIYNPRQTRFIKKFKEKGCTAVNGTGMLLHQGAQAFELWTGLSAPLDVMHRALQNYIK
ncbi:MAG: shikimate dehydrogenase [Clostridiales bacterium]|nr:shikimate dehydrogenase [Clostridiales bacterium]MCF8021132.1 shikimate dehydrogenase [Clostridiales bacterium]